MDMLCGIRARTPTQISRTIGDSLPSPCLVSWDETTSSGKDRSSSVVSVASSQNGLKVVGMDMPCP